MWDEKYWWFENLDFKRRGIFKSEVSYQDDGTLEMKVYLPGYNKKHISVSCSDELLIEVKKDDTQFSEYFTIPDGYVVEDNCKMEDGVLYIKMRKNVVSKKITVK